MRLHPSSQIWPNMFLYFAVINTRDHTGLSWAGGGGGGGGDDDDDDDVDVDVILKSL
jgi:hypothetical protein